MAASIPVWAARAALYQGSGEGVCVVGRGRGELKFLETFADPDAARHDQLFDAFAGIPGQADGQCGPFNVPEEKVQGDEFG